jgi:hypothetical protein
LQQKASRLECVRALILSVPRRAVGEHEAQLPWSRLSQSMDFGRRVRRHADPAGPACSRVVRCCGSPRASSPHDLTAPALASHDGRDCVQLPLARGCYHLAPRRTFTSNPVPMPGTPSATASGGFGLDEGPAIDSFAAERSKDRSAPPTKCGTRFSPSEGPENRLFGQKRRSPESPRRSARGTVEKAHASPLSPQEQNQKERTFDVLPKPANLISYRH